MHHYTEQEKHEWLSKWKASGKSAKSFAEGKPLSASSLHYWNRKFKSANESSFIQVVADQPRTSPYARLTYPSGVILEIYDSVTPEYFKGLLQ